MYIGICRTILRGSTPGEHDGWTMHARQVVAAFALVLAIAFGVVFAFPEISALQGTAEAQTSGNQQAFIQRLAPMFVWVFAGIVAGGSLVAFVVLALHPLRDR